MAHMLEQYGEMASFASKRQPAWHGLGTVFEDEKTTSEMLEAANLSNWDVRQEPITLPGRYHGGEFFRQRTHQPIRSRNRCARCRGCSLQGFPK